MTYNPRSIFQSYDQYGRAKKKQASKPNPGKQFADSMKAGGGGRNMSGIGAKPAPSRTSTFDQFKRRERNKGLASRPSFGGAQDNNPNRDEAENKSSVKKLYEKTVNFLKSFGADEPEALIVDGQRVYQGPAFRGFQPTIPTENFGGRFGKQQYLFDSPELGIKTTRSPVPPTLPPGTVNRLGVNRDNPRLNMFGVNRGFTKPPASPELPTSPDVPANVDAITRGISQALIPTEVEYTIKVGDTLSEIAEDRGTTVEVLMELNNIKEKDKDTIFAGDKLKVPPKKAKTYKDVDDNLFVSSGQIMSDAYDPDSQYYESFRQGITPLGLMSRRPKIRPEVSEISNQKVFSKIMKGESTDFNDVSNTSKIKPPKPITEMTVAEVREWQDKSVEAGSKSSSVGRYQIIRATMDDLIAKGAINEDDIFNEETQNKAFKSLLDRRGYTESTLEIKLTKDKDKKKEIAENLQNRLAMEFASIPVATSIPAGTYGTDLKGNPIPKVDLKPGDTFYKGDGLNKALHKYNDFLKVLMDIK